MLDEALLRRPIGGIGVQRDQLRALITACDLPAVRLQVVRFNAGGHAAAGGAFSILRFPHQDLPDIVYIEHLTNALYLEKRDDVDQYAAVVGRLFIEAEPPARTPDILREVLNDLDS